MTAMNNNTHVRPIEGDDLDALLALCREHAAYEKAEFFENGQIERWRAALFSTQPTMYCWVAVDNGDPCGFMTVTVDFATWTAEYFAHMDCLFLQKPYRGRGLGRLFFDKLRDFCVNRQYKLVQWQTPPDNKLGISFYRRVGAYEKPKLRFFYDISA